MSYLASTANISFTSNNSLSVILFNLLFILTFLRHYASGLKLFLRFFKVFWLDLILSAKYNIQSVLSSNIHQE